MGDKGESIGQGLFNSRGFGGILDEFENDLVTEITGLAAEIRSRTGPGDGAV